MTRDRDKRKKRKKQQERAAAKMAGGSLPDFIGDRTPVTMSEQDIHHVCDDPSVCDDPKCGEGETA